MPRFHILDSGGMARSDLPKSPRNRLRQLGNPWLRWKGGKMGKTHRPLDMELLMVTRNPVNSPVEVGSLFHYLQGFIQVRWLFGMSSINRIISS